MIPLTFLYDEYIDRPKFTEQKKNPFEYIVPSPTSGVGTIRNIIVNCSRTKFKAIIVAMWFLDNFLLDSSVFSSDFYHARLFAFRVI